MNINFWKSYFPILYNFVWKQFFSTVVEEHFRALRKAKPWLALRSQAFGGVRHVISGFQKQLFLPNVDVVGNFQGHIANTAVTRGAGRAITPYGCLCSFSCKWTRSGGVVCARIQACHWSVFVKQPLENVTGEAEKQQRQFPLKFLACFRLVNSTWKWIVGREWLWVGRKGSITSQAGGPKTGEPDFFGVRVVTCFCVIFPDQVFVIGMNISGYFSSLLCGATYLLIYFFCLSVKIISRQ